MASWKYWLIDDDDPHVWGGTDASPDELPAGTDFARASFLNQFVDRLNARAELVARLGGSASGIDRVAPGDVFTRNQESETGFVYSFWHALEHLSYGTDKRGIAEANIPEGDDLVLAWPASGATSIASYEFMLYASDDKLKLGDEFWKARRFRSMRTALHKLRFFGKDNGCWNLRSNVSCRHQWWWGYELPTHDESDAVDDWISAEADDDDFPCCAERGPADYGGGSGGFGVNTGAIRRVTVADGEVVKYEFITMSHASPTVLYGELGHGVAFRCRTFKYAEYYTGDRTAPADFWSEEFADLHKLAMISDFDDYPAEWLGSGNGLNVGLGATIGVTDITDKTTGSGGIDRHGYNIGTAIIFEVNDAAAEYDEED